MICRSHVDTHIDQPPPSSLGSSDTSRLWTVSSTPQIQDRLSDSSRLTHELTQIRGTPNSATTSLSALSTTAIKDGHQGHAAPHTHNHTASSGSSSSTNTLDAERADRISRLAGLERVATVRGAQAYLNAGAQVNQQQHHHPGYFDNAGNQLGKERSTVGSASATGSLGGGTTWASGSDVYDVDKMSEDQDDGLSSAGLSDEGNASLVGFGEGASSTISGPVSRAVGPKIAGGLGSPAATKLSHRDPGSPMQGVQEGNPQTPSGLSYNGDEFDTPQNETCGARDASLTTQQRAEDFMRARLGNEGRRPLGSPQEGNALGKFHFEEK